MHPLHTLLNNQPVQWKTLGEVAELQRGKTLTAKTASAGNIPVISGGQKPAYYTGDHNRDGETITIAGSGAYAGHIMYWNEPIFVSDAFSIKPSTPELNTKFLHYFLQLNQTKIYNMKRGAGVPHVYPKDVATIATPIPPLALQARIVEILDKFTACIDALNKEHTLRKKQYAYYRDLLLSEAELSKVGFEWKALGEIASDFGRGKSKHRPRNDERLYGGNVPFIQTGDIRNASKYIQQYSQTYSELGLQQSKLWKKDTLCITIAANIAETAILDFDACFPDSVIGFVPDPKQANVSYVYYVLQSLKEKLQSFSTGGAQENINLGTFEQIKFPIPPLAHQRKIVDILDRFDTLTNSITQGIPREIELRRKQYEYYRELLLTFE